MSRASDVRDAVKLAVESELTDQTVETFIVPSYTREELNDGPRVVIRTGGREVGFEQGFDPVDVIIEIGVVGILPQAGEDDVESFREIEVAKCDEYDALIETVIGLFLRDGALKHCPMAEHRFQQIEQAIQFDAQKLYNDGVWLSLIQLTYQDSRDD